MTTTSDLEAADGLCSLREAIVAANDDLPYSDCTAGNGEDSIVFTVHGTIVLAGDLPTIVEGLSILGPGVDQLTIDGSSLFGVFELDSPSGDQTLRISGLDIRNGDGVCVASRHGDSLEVVDSWIRSCTGPLSGGVLADGSAYALVLRSAIFDNSASVGGGIGAHGDGILEVRESTLSRNSADLGGGVYTDFSMVTIDRSTICRLPDEITRCRFDEILYCPTRTEMFLFLVKSR